MSPDAQPRSVDWLARLQHLRGVTVETAETPSSEGVSAVSTVGGGGERVPAPGPGPAPRGLDPDQGVASDDQIARTEYRAGLGSQTAPVEEGAVITTPSVPWRCFSCRSGERRHRPAWGDWVCAFCGVIVAAPEETERPWHLSGPRTAGTPLAGQDRQGHRATIVRWSRDLRGWIAATDPDTGETVEIPHKEAPAVWQAAVRSRRKD